MKNILDAIHAFIDKHKLITPNATIVVGLSGGPDSVFLLHYLCQRRAELNLTLIAAHLDHGWRADSYKDIEFCLEMTKQLNVQLICQKLSDLGLKLKFNGSQEEIGRKARRHFFSTVQKEHHANFIALAHHAQDQQETFFIRLMRGASLSGLVAMKPKDGVYIRPLLQTNKQDLLDYLHANDIPYLIDPTNSSDAYLRNRIRAHVVPALQQADARFDQNFATTLQRLHETEEFLQELTKKTFIDSAHMQEDIWHVDTNKLIALHPVMLYRILLHWLCLQGVPFTPTQSFFDEIIRFCSGPASKEHLIHPAWKIIKKKHLAHIVTYKTSSSFAINTLGYTKIET